MGLERNRYGLMAQSKREQLTKFELEATEWRKQIEAMTIDYDRLVHASIDAGQTPFPQSLHYPPPTQWMYSGAPL